MKKTVVLSALLCLFASLSALATPSAAQPEKAPPSSPTAATPELLAGKVLQTMDSGGYTYIYIEKKNGKKVWVAVPETPVKVGNAMTFKPGEEMVKFESKSLKRTFDSIIFSNGVLTGAVEASPSKIKESGPSPGSQGAVADKETKIAVGKATGSNATTVEGSYTNSAKLNGKKVVVKGKVVKVSAGIMNRNWIHIQDGTGSQTKGTHNLVCTSNDMADVGDTITVTGKLIKDKNFGAGYKYKVIIEDSKISK